jgi:hypothetical protein
MGSDPFGPITGYSVREAVAYDEERIMSLKDFV